MAAAVNSLVAYDHLCPGCGAKHSVGYNSEGTAWETRCTRCKITYRYGEFSHVAAVWDFRCPNCNKRRHLGVSMPGSWWETKCFRCRHFYHYGHLGRGEEAIVTVLGSRDRNDAQSHVRTVRVEGQALETVCESVICSPGIG